MLCEVGNCRKRAKRVLRVKLNSTIRKQKSKNSVRGVAALFRRVAPKGGLTVAPFGIFDKRKSPIPSQSHSASGFGLRIQGVALVFCGDVSVLIYVSLPQKTETPHQAQFHKPVKILEHAVACQSISPRSICPRCLFLGLENQPRVSASYRKEISPCPPCTQC